MVPKQVSQQSFGEGRVGSFKQNPWPEQHPWAEALALGPFISHLPVILSLGAGSYDATPLSLAFPRINPNFFPSLLPWFGI